MTTILHTEWSKGWGGQEIRILQDVHELQKRGYRAIIACQPDSRIFQTAGEQGIPVIPLKMRTAIDLGAIWKCMGIIREYSVDLVHTHSSVDSWCCSIASKILGVPVIRSRHISAPVNTNYFSFFLYMKLADQIITSGRAIKNRMVEVNGYDPHKIVSIPTGIDEKIISAPAKRDPIRKEFNIGEDDFLLGIVAMLRSWKGHLHLLEAFKSLQEDIPHLKLLIVGDGPQEKSLLECIKRNGLRHRVIMAGYRKDVPAVLKGLDLFVLPSYSNEGIPQSLLQAMALEIPAISTAVGGIGEIIEDRKTGLLVPPRDVTALREGILWGYQHRAEMGEMAREARQFVLNNYTADKLFIRTEKIYQELLFPYSAKLVPGRDMRQRMR